jgi:hypothetical protein
VSKSIETSISEFKFKIENQHISYNNEQILNALKAMAEIYCYIGNDIHHRIDKLLLSKRAIIDQPEQAQHVTHLQYLCHTLLYNVIDPLLIKHIEILCSTSLANIDVLTRLNETLAMLEGAIILQLRTLQLALKGLFKHPLARNECLLLFLDYIRQAETEQKYSFHCPISLILGTLLLENSFNDDSFSALLEEVSNHNLSTPLINQALESVSPTLEARSIPDIDQSLLLAPQELWSIGVKIGVACETEQVNEVRKITDYLRQRLLPLYFTKAIIKPSQDKYNIASNEHPYSSRIDLQQIGNLAGVDGYVATSALKGEKAILGFIPAHSVVFAHSFFLNRFFHDHQCISKALPASIIGANIAYDKRDDCHKPLFQYVPNLLSVLYKPEIKATPYVWLPHHKHLYRPTISQTASRNALSSLTDEFLINEDLTTFGSNAGVHDQIVIPNTIIPMEAAMLAWSMKAPEMVFKDSQQSLEQLDFNKRESCRIRIVKRDKALSISQSNKRRLINQILDDSCLDSETSNLISYFLHGYTLKILSGISDLERRQPAITEKQLLNIIKPFVSTTPPYAFDHNLRLLLLGYNILPALSSRKDNLNWNLITLLYNAPTTFVDFFSQHTQSSHQEVVEVLNLVSSSSQTSDSSLATRFKEASVIEFNPVYPYQRGVNFKITYLNLFRPLSEHLIRYGLSLDGGIILAAKALHLIE